jgi:hypothetical protein
MFWELFGLRALEFPGSLYLLFALSSAVYFYGGWPFLRGLADELRLKNPGMMTLIAIAITVAYVYSSAVVFGLAGMIFFWETATLIDIMLARPLDRNEIGDGRITRARRAGATDAFGCTQAHARQQHSGCAFERAGGGRSRLDQAGRKNCCGWRSGRR